MTIRSLNVNDQQWLSQAMFSGFKPCVLSPPNVDTFMRHHCQRRSPPGQLERRQRRDQVLQNNPAFRAYRQQSRSVGVETHPARHRRVTSGWYRPGALVLARKPDEILVKKLSTCISLGLEQGCIPLFPSRLAIQSTLLRKIQCHGSIGPLGLGCEGRTFRRLLRFTVCSLVLIAGVEALSIRFLLRSVRPKMHV